MGIVGQDRGHSYQHGVATEGCMSQDTQIEGDHMCCLGVRLDLVLFGVASIECWMHVMVRYLYGY